MHGSPTFADRVPDKSDVLVKVLESRGGLVLAKSNTPEFAAGANTFNQVFGNVRGPWLEAKYAMPVMSQGGGGSIVITSSGAGLNGTPGMCAYGISNHTVIGLMRTAAFEGAPFGMRANTVNPDPIETRMMRSIENMRVASVDDSAVTAYVVKQTAAPRIPLERYGTPEEVANLMLFLASDESSFCSGGVHTVDGGRGGGRPVGFSSLRRGQIPGSDDTSTTLQWVYVKCHRFY